MTEQWLNDHAVDLTTLAARLSRALGAVPWPIAVAAS
jgi:hypothetical protein